MNVYIKTKQMVVLEWELNTGCIGMGKCIHVPFPVSCLKSRRDM